jgi:hypothetical protein
MRTIPYGYRIEGGKATICKEEAEKLHQLFKNYLAGMSLSKAASDAGIQAMHSSIKRLLENRHYQGDDFYPAITDKETLDQIHEERIQRAEQLGRLHPSRKPETKKPAAIKFTISAPEQTTGNPKKRAEYLYSLIESEE